MSNSDQQNGGPPPWVTAGGRIPPSVIASHNGALPTLLSGTAEPPTSILPQLTSALATSIAAGATGPPSGLILPSGVAGTFPGFTPPPAGFSIPSGVTGPPTGFPILSGVTGFPAAFTGIPSISGGNPNAALPPQLRNHALTQQQSQTLIGVTCMLLVLCVAAVGARLAARRVSRMRLEADDWSSVAALAFFVALCIEQFVLAKFGMRMLHDFPPPANVMHVFGKAEFASQLTYAFVTTATKVSLLMLYRRIFSLRLKWFRIAWWTAMALAVALLVALIALQCTQCTPISTVWNAPGSCLPSQPKTSSLGFVNALIDSAILVLPIRMVWSLQMSQKQKLAICGVFGLGMIAVTVSIARAVALASPALFKDGGLGLILWSTTEPAVALICSCLPVLRPLYTTGLKRLGASRGWNWYTSKRSKTSDYSQGSSSRDKEITNLSGSTVRSQITPETKHVKFWSNINDSEMSGPYEEIHSPDLHLDKPLPPAYSPRQEEDTGYHTWSWNLLSRPRHEDKAPKLTRAPTVKDGAISWRSPTSLPSPPETGVRTIVSRGFWSNKITPLRFKEHPSKQTKPPTPRSRSDIWDAPVGTAMSNISKAWSPTPNLRGDVNTRNAPSPLPPMRHVSKCDKRHHSTGSPEGGFLLPPKPRPMARIESEERIAPPRLTVRTASSPPPNSPSSFAAPGAHNSWNCAPQIVVSDQSREWMTPGARRGSDVTLWPA